jgi:hypothetical protein
LVEQLYQQLLPQVLEFLFGLPMMVTMIMLVALEEGQEVLLVLVVVMLP